MPPCEVLAVFRRDLGPLVFDTVIHKALHITARAGEGQPIVLLDPKSRGAREYEALTDNVLTRGGTHHGSYP